MVGDTDGGGGKNHGYKSVHQVVLPYTVKLVSYKAGGQVALPRSHIDRLLFSDVGINQKRGQPA